MKYLSEKSTWFNPSIEYLFNSIIYEYDIKNAGFSIIKAYNLLTDQEIRQLNQMEKKQQIIEIGKKMGQNREFSENLTRQFGEIRKFFIDSNYITDNDLIAVKKDALFCTKECRNLNFGGIEFRVKNQYSSYIRFPYNNNLEIYYNDGGKIDVKGISEINLNKHRLFMLEFIKKIINYLEDKNLFIKRYFKKFVDSYRFLELENEFYLEFNNLSNQINPLFNYQNVIIPFAQIITKEIH